MSTIENLALIALEKTKDAAARFRRWTDSQSAGPKSITELKETIQELHRAAAAAQAVLDLFERADGEKLKPATKQLSTGFPEGNAA